MMVAFAWEPSPSEETFQIVDSPEETIRCSAVEERPNQDRRGNHRSTHIHGRPPGLAGFRVQGMDHPAGVSETDLPVRDATPPFDGGARGVCPL